jgi:hypothetical protein
MSEEAMDVRTAADLMRQTQQRTRNALEIRLAPVYAAWGVAWLGGLGGMWLSVHGQQPFRDPSGLSAAVLGVLNCLAVTVTITVVIRASRGVGGVTALQGRMFGVAWLLGYSAVFAIDGALASHGASHAVQGIAYATAPVVVTALIYLAGAAVWLETSMFVLGAWLAVVSVGAAWAGPVGALAIGALAGGGGFLLTAALVLLRRRQHDGS